MDVFIYTKETIKQPDGNTERLVDNVFDLKPILEGEQIVNIELVDDKEELKQQAVFAALKQRGSDPLSMGDGVQWANAVIGEVSGLVIMSQIKNEVNNVSPSCNVEFSLNNKEKLSFTIEVTT